MAVTTLSISSLTSVMHRLALGLPAPTGHLWRVEPKLYAYKLLAGLGKSVCHDLVGDG